MKFQTDSFSPLSSAPVKRVSPHWRTAKAYFVTLVVIISYRWLRFRSEGGAEAADALEEAHRRNARRIYRAISGLQGLYIKVGQTFSIMTNFLPQAFREELAALQDRLPARPYREIEQRIRDEFGGLGPHELFESFDETPLASASIGQVHLARLKSGQRVAVKVQYPYVEQFVQDDLRALKRIFRIVGRVIAYRGMDVLFREIRAMVLRELDFREEANSIEAIAKNFAGRSDVCFPKVFRELSTQRVLTTEYIEGIKVNDVQELERRGINRADVAKLVIESCCQQIFNHGMYHADPHPGNILVTEGPTIYYVDFGAVGQVSPNMRNGLVTLLQGALRRDTAKIIAGLRDMGFLAYEADARIYDRIIEYFHNRFQQEVQIESFNLRDIRFDPQKSFEDIADLRNMNIALADITKSFVVPREWILLERTILLVMGLCTELEPELNPTQIVRPYVEEFVFGEDGDRSRLMLDTSRELIINAVGLPAEIKKLIAQAMQGELEVRLSGSGARARLQYAAVHQLIYSAFTLVSAVGALLCYMRGEIYLATSCASTSAGFFVLLLRSMWKSRGLLRQVDHPANRAR